MGSTALDQAAVIQVSKMPSREEVLGSIANMLGAPASNIASVLTSPAVNIAGILSTLEEQRAA